MNEQFDIRLVNNKDDLKLIRQIALNTWPHTFKDILSVQQLDYMLELMYSLSSLENQFINKHHQFVIGFEDVSPVGFAGFEINLHNKPVLKIHKLYFLPAKQGKGYGKAVINFLSNLALQHNQSIISLNVNRFNRAIDFYKHIGFKITGEEVIDIGSDYVMDDYIMDLALKK